MTGRPLLLQGPVFVEPPPPLPPMPPDVGVIVGGGPLDALGPYLTLIVAIVGATIVLAPFARAWARRIERREAPALPTDVAARLERIETAVESMAVEIERISEGQRFLTRVMSDLRALPGAEEGRAVAAGRTPGQR